MRAPADHVSFLSDYRRYVLEVVNPVRLRLRLLLRELQAPNYWHEYRHPPLPIPSPVLQVSVRVKRAEAVVDKVMRNPDRFSDLSLDSVAQMGDVLGGRIVVAFVPHLSLVDRELRAHAGLRLWSQKRPRAHLHKDDARTAGIDLSDFDCVSKEWGSAALVYWLCFADDSDERAPFELQVVTLLENAWGEVERQLGYRAQKQTSQQVRREFSSVGSELREVERRLTKLSASLREFQRADIGLDAAQPLNAENLPRLLHDSGIAAAQRELEGMLKVLASRGVTSVGDLQARATARALDLIRKTYSDEAGWSPSSFEIVAVLAMLGSQPTDDDVVKAARLNHEYSEHWDETVRETRAPLGGSVEASRQRRRQSSE